MTAYQVLPEFQIFHLCQEKTPFTEGTLGNTGVVLVLAQLSLFCQSGVQALYFGCWIHNSAKVWVVCFFFTCSWWVHKNLPARHSKPKSKARNKARNWNLRFLFHTSSCLIKSHYYLDCACYLNYCSIREQIKLGCQSPKQPTTN